MEQNLNIIYDGLSCPKIPEGKAIKFIGIDNPFMKRAREVARGSNDKQQPVGAVVVCNGEIVAESPNTHSLDNPWIIDLHQKFCIRHFLGVKSGHKYWMCPGCVTGEEHAESRCSKKIFDKKFDGVLEIYVWGHWCPCAVCWKNMQKVNISVCYLLSESHKLFNVKNDENILGRQFALD